MGGENPLTVLLLLLPWFLVFGIAVYAIVMTIRLFREGRRDRVSKSARGDQAKQGQAD